MSGGSAMAAGAIAVRKLDALAEYDACVALERQIWGEADLEVEPATLFVVASHTGGQVLGAFDGGRLVGYTLALVGLLEGTPYLHSHMTGVLAEYRDRGVGRMLKLYQREEALGRGIRLIQWTFDPFELRNAHFNLNRLGVICRKYLPNLYGVTTSPLHRGMATDRLLAEWRLDSARVVACVTEVASGEWPFGSQGKPVASETHAGIRLPAELERWKEQGSPELGQLQDRVRREFRHWFAKGYAAVGLRKTAAGAEYLLAPWSDF
jgi:predicted GNAT superfamily acetyltransferase